MNQILKKDINASSSTETAINGRTRYYIKYRTTICYYSKKQIDQQDPREREIIMNSFHIIFFPGEIKKNATISTLMKIEM